MFNTLNVRGQGMLTGQGHLSKNTMMVMMTIFITVFFGGFFICLSTNKECQEIHHQSAMNITMLKSIVSLVMTR